MILLFLGVTWFIKTTSLYNLITDIKFICAKFIGAINFMIYEHVSKLSQFILNKQEIGKIINVISNDFNLL